MNFRRLDFAHEWELYGENIRTEFTQCLEEGKDVEQYRAEVEAIEQMQRSLEKEARADKLFYEFLNAPQRADYPYEEPSDYEGILAARPKNRKAYKKPAADDKLYDQVYGAWLGRICGCLLGKPVEGLKSEEIERLCKAEGNFPLSRYMGSEPEAVIRAGLDEGRKEYLQKCYKPGYMPADDDTNYTCMAAMKVIDIFGREFTPDDMAHTWLNSQPMSAYCTAERVAFMNFATAIAPPESAIYKNAFREWIGAQIRGDYFGYICPGDPEAAARMAFNDACISHVKNGIYGEMFIAAALAAAAVSDDMLEILQAGLNEIPEKSRLAEDVGNVMKWYREGVSKEETFKRIHTQWDEYSGHDWCHTNSNAMIVAAVLLYGGMDYGRTICMAVETGFDTDCNGATAGSILGMVKGREAIGPEWYEAIDDQVETSIVGLGTYKLAELAALTMKHIGA